MNRGGICYVGRTDQSVPSVSANLVSHSLQAFLASGQKCHAHSLPGQSLGRSRSDPARGSCDQRHLPGQRRHQRLTRAQEIA